MKTLSLVVAFLASSLVLGTPAARSETAVADVFYNEALKNDPSNIDKAAQLYASAISEFEKVGRKDDRYATCLSNLAQIELKGNDLTGAEANIKKSLDASQDHQIMAKNYQMMGDIKAKQDKLSEADGAYSGTLEIFSKYGDPNHQQAPVLEKLASICDRMGKGAEASALRVKATDLATFQSGNQAAQNGYKRGTKALIANDYTTAIKEFEQALQLQSDFKAARMNLAICYQHEALEHEHKSEWSEAEANYLLALPAMEAAFGAKHAYTCTVLQGLCETLESEKKFDDAEKYASQWVDIEREINKSGQPVVNALRAYSRILKANKKEDKAAAIDKELAGDEAKDKSKLDFSSYLEKKNDVAKTLQKERDYLAPTERGALDVVASKSTIDLADAQMAAKQEELAESSYKKAISIVEGETTLLPQKLVATKKLASFYKSAGNQEQYDKLKKEGQVLTVMASADIDTSQSNKKSRLALDLSLKNAIAKQVTPRLRENYDRDLLQWEREDSEKIGKNENEILKSLTVSEAKSSGKAESMARAQSRFYEAVPALKTGHYQNAIEPLKAAINEDPSWLWPKDILGRVYHNLAIKEQQEGKYREAENSYRNALTLLQNLFGEEDPHACNVLQGLTENLVAQHRFSEAEKVCRRWARNERESQLWTGRALQALMTYSSILRKENKLKQAEELDREIAEGKQVLVAGSSKNK